jgi:hypothetical protein
MATSSLPRTLWRAILFVFRDWGSGMTGTLSIPFTVAALMNLGSDRRIFIFLAFFALLVTILRLAYNSVRTPQISGTWKRQIKHNIVKDSLTMHIIQDGEHFTASYSTKEHDHTAIGTFNSSTRKFDYTAERTNRATKGATMMHGTVSIIDNDTLYGWVSGTDGADDLPIDFTEPSIITRV